MKGSLCLLERKIFLFLPDKLFFSLIELSPQFNTLFPEEFQLSGQLHTFLISLDFLVDVFVLLLGEQEFVANPIHHVQEGFQKMPFLLFFEFVVERTDRLQLLQDHGLHLLHLLDSSDLDWLRH